ncbi:hypothetical protein ACHAXT_009856 [Thalassiosira profunda]
MHLHNAPALLFLLYAYRLERCLAFGGAMFVGRRPVHVHRPLPLVSPCTRTVGGQHRALRSERGDAEPQPAEPQHLSSEAGELERLKQEEKNLASLLASVRQQKLSVLRSRPLKIGVVGFGRFGQFIAKSFAKYGNVVGTSRTDYSALASEIGTKFIPLSDLEAFVVDEDPDVIVLAVSIVSFADTVRDLVPHLQTRMERRGRDACPLIVDVASVKEHPRSILLEHLPKECDILCTHPMFGPDSAKHGWAGQTFVYEKTRVNGVLLESVELPGEGKVEEDEDGEAALYFDGRGALRGVADDDCEAHVEGMDRIERFLSIWEEEGCDMTPLSCQDHDAYAANSQFITHLMGRILGAQGLVATPIDTKGFQSVLRLIENTNADSFDLFYGLYKYNRNSGFTIGRLRGALDDVVGELLHRDGVVGVFNRRDNEEAT